MARGFSFEDWFWELGSTENTHSFKSFSLLFNLPRFHGIEFLGCWFGRHILLEKTLGIVSTWSLGGKLVPWKSTESFIVKQMREPCLFLNSLNNFRVSEARLSQRLIEPPLGELNRRFPLSKCLINMLVVHPRQHNLNQFRRHLSAIFSSRPWFLASLLDRIRIQMKLGVSKQLIPLHKRMHRSGHLCDGSLFFTWFVYFMHSLYRPFVEYNFLDVPNNLFYRIHHTNLVFRLFFVHENRRLLQAASPWRLVFRNFLLRWNSLSCISHWTHFWIVTLLFFLS